MKESLERGGLTTRKKGEEGEKEKSEG